MVKFIKKCNFGGGGTLSLASRALRACDVVKLFGQEVERIFEDNTLSRIAKIRSRSLSNSTLSQGERKFVNTLSWERGRGEGNSLFAQQTVTNSSSYRPNVLTTFKDCAIADRATLVRNDEKNLVPQYLSALVPSKRAAFTKPSRGTSDSERRTIINGNRAAWLSAINGFLCFAQQNSNTLCRQSAFRFDCERCRLTRGAAFTLAEVLITLGIIGVVAAITIPNLVQNYKKSEASARLKKFNSMMSQAVLMSEQDNGPAENWSTGDDGTNFDLENYFTTYLAPYLQYTKTKSLTAIRRYYIYLADGTYFYLVKGNCVDVVYFVNGKKNPVEGKDIFHFLLCGSGVEKNWCDGRHFCPYYNTGMSTREQRLESCKKSESYCSGLLEMDNWEFKDDYPFRL